MQSRTNPDAKDAVKIAPSGLKEWEARRFHIELNHDADRETVLLK